MGATPIDRSRDHASRGCLYGIAGQTGPAFLHLRVADATALAYRTEPLDFRKDRYGAPADTLAEMDYHVGSMLDAVERSGVRDKTIVIFTSDNGPEFVKPWDGWAGLWRGQSLHISRGGIRVPFLIRWHHARSRQVE